MSINDFLVSEEQLADLKKVGLSVLKDLHEICQKNGLKYSLAFGTMLGAVRHKGFIPWDDDIDVLMPRSDYEKFCEIVAKEYKEDYWVRNVETDKFCPFYFGKFMKKGTVLKEFLTESIPMTYGVFIDIFILDYVPTSEAKKTKIRKKFNFFAHMAWLRCEYKFPSKTLIKINKSKDRKAQRKKYNLRRTLGFFASFLPLKFWTNKMINVVKKQKEADKYWTGIKLKEINKCEMDDLVLYDFEDTKVYGLKDFDSYLKAQYGKNYMELPPVEKRERHMVIDLKI